jgi:hypothetical protein
MDWQEVMRYHYPEEEVRWRQRRTLDWPQDLTDFSHLITLKRELFLGINLCFFRFEYRSKGEHFSVDASYGPEVCH